LFVKLVLILVNKDIVFLGSSQKMEGFTPEDEKVGFDFFKYSFDCQDHQTGNAPADEIEGRWSQLPWKSTELLIERPPRTKTKTTFVLWGLQRRINDADKMLAERPQTIQKP